MPRSAVRMRAASFACAAFLAIALAAPVARAAAPSTLGYQGVLTDPLGNLVPDAGYDLVFTLWDAASAGNALWTETHNAVPVAKGGFSVVLGSITPLTLEFDRPMWLGIKVASDPEMTPRVPLTASPYALGLRLPYIAAGSEGTPLLTLQNTGSGPALRALNRVEVGSSAGDGVVNVYRNGSGNPVARLANGGIHGGELELYDEQGFRTLLLEPDVDGVGGIVTVIGNTSETKALYLTGNHDGNGNPSLSGTGVSFFQFNTASTGNPSVTLPTDAISSGEVLDEPGIAQGKNVGTFNLTGSMTDYALVTITIPASGYVVVEGTATHVLDCDGTNPNTASLQVDETSGGAADASHAVSSGLSGPARSETRPLAFRRTYFKAAGTHTFRLEALAANPGAATNAIVNPSILARFYPTSYGGVTSIVSDAEAGAFARAERTPGGGAIVDLRELELAASRARAEAERAERALAEAKRARQAAGGRVAGK